jgi:hypothetical protein
MKQWNSCNWTVGVLPKDTQVWADLMPMRWIHRQDPMYTCKHRLLRQGEEVKSASTNGDSVREDGEVFYHVFVMTMSQSQAQFP